MTILAICWLPICLRPPDRRQYFLFPADLVIFSTTLFTAQPSPPRPLARSVNNHSADFHDFFADFAIQL
jgi:hypothetical protein